MLLSRIVTAVLTINLVPFGAGVAFGQDYPSKPIRLIMGPAGGGADFTARLIGPGMSSALGQPVIVDNRSSGFVPMEAVAKAPSDGYTLLINGGSTWINPLLQKTPYDPVSDFAPVTVVTREVLVLAVHPSMPVKSVKELVALAKAKPGELNYASGSIGGPPHLGVELLKSMAGVNIVNVPYKGSAAGITALISGEVQLTIYDAGLLMPHVKAGKLRAVAVTSAEPSALTPGIRTIAGSGLPGYELVGRTGVWAPAKTSVAIVSRLNQEIVRVLAVQEVKDKFLTAGAETVGGTPEQFAATIKTEMDKWRKVIREAGIKPI